MGYFKQLSIELEEIGVDWQEDAALQKAKPKKKKLKNPCQQCFNSEASRGRKLCLWCYCDPRHYWNY